MIDLEAKLRAEGIQRDQVRISDHAIARWLERAGGLAAIRDEILSPTTLLGLALDARRVHRPEAGVTLIVRDRTIVTVLPLERGAGPDHFQAPRRAAR